QDEGSILERRGAPLLSRGPRGRTPRGDGLLRTTVAQGTRDTILARQSHRGFRTLPRLVRGLEARRAVSGSLQRRKRGGRNLKRPQVGGQSIVKDRWLSGRCPLPGNRAGSTAYRAALKRARPGSPVDMK